MKHFMLLLMSLSFFSSAALADTNFDLDAYKGKFVYVDFWASWCAPCRASFPFMQELVERYGNSLVVVAINVDENRANADRFLEQFDVDFEIFYDPEGIWPELFGLVTMPSSYLHDREGQLIGTHYGFTEKSKVKIENVIADVINNSE